jgi:hypothetical protein
VVVKSLAAFMALRKLQPFFPPDPLNILMIDASAFFPQELPDLPIVLATIPLG